MQQNTGNSNQAYSPKTILILGAGLMQCPAIFSAKLLGCRVIVADVNNTALGIAHADEFWHIDLRDTAALVERALEVKLDGVLTCATDFSYSVASIAHACKLPGISTSTAEIANYKHKMRDCLQQAGVAVPKYFCLNFENTEAPAGMSAVSTGALSQSQLDNYASCIHTEFRGNYPVVIKPVDNMGARGVLLVHNKENLAQAIAYAQSFSAINAIVAEEYLSGPELSIDSCIIDGLCYPLGIADRHIYFSPYFVETGHSIPSSLPNRLQRRACEELAKAARATGIYNGICKGDIIFHNNKAYIGEFAARLSGGYMSGWTIPATEFSFMGQSPTDIAIKQALGIAIATPYKTKHHKKLQNTRCYQNKLKVQRKTIPETRKMLLQKTCTAQTFKYLRSHTNRYVAERALLALPGIVNNVLIDEDFYVQSALHNFFINAKIGEASVLPQYNPQKAGAVISSAHTRQEADHQAVILLTKIYFKIEINDEANNFLFAADANTTTVQTWRCYPFNKIETEARGNLLSLLESSQLFDKHNILKALPVWVPKELLSNKHKGTWTHVHIATLLRLAEEKDLIVCTNLQKNSSGGLFWSAILRGGWQGLLYLRQVLEECRDILQNL